MLNGLLYGVLASLLWGFSYVAPSLLESFEPPEIFLGRNLGFGFISMLVYFFLHKKDKTGLTIPATGRGMRAFSLIQLALTGYIFYDYLDIMNLRINGPQNVGLFYGVTLLVFQLINKSLSDKRRPSKRELIKVFIMLDGLMLLFWGVWDFSVADKWLMGTVISILQSTMWIWFTSSISKCSRSDCENEPSSVMITAKIGNVCLFFSVISACFYIFISDGEPYNYFTKHSFVDWGWFLVIGFLAGGGFAWLAAGLWCRASKAVPYQILSHLLLADVVAGRIFSYFFDGTPLTLLHLLGAFILLGGWTLLMNYGKRTPDNRLLYQS